MPKKKHLNLNEWIDFLRSEIYHTHIAILNVEKLFNKYEEREYLSPFFHHYIFMSFPYSVIGLRKLCVCSKTEHNSFIELYNMLQDDKYITENYIEEKILTNVTTDWDNHVTHKKMRDEVGFFQSIAEMKNFCEEQISCFKEKVSIKCIEQLRAKLAHGTTEFIKEYTLKEIKYLKCLSYFTKERFNILCSKLGIIHTQFDNICDIEFIIDAYNRGLKH